MIRQFLSFTTFVVLIGLFCLNVHSKPPTSNRSENISKRIKLLLKKELKKKGLSLGSPIFVRIFKKSSLLEIWVKKSAQFELFKTYHICYYSGNLGPKEKKGDLQAPEGFYFVKSSAMNPYSQFHLSFNLGYPNKYDSLLDRTGSLLMIHGECVSIGCFAMGNKGIEEIYTLAEAALESGQSFFRVHVFPFKMTNENLAAYKESKWHEFWKNLKEGYDFFERHKIPPNVGVKDKLYIFDS